MAAMSIAIRVVNKKCLWKVLQSERFQLDLGGKKIKPERKTNGQQQKAKPNQQNKNKNTNKKTQIPNPTN